MPKGRVEITERWTSLLGSEILELAETYWAIKYLYLMGDFFQQVYIPFKEN